MSLVHDKEENWAFATNIATGTGTTVLVAAPAAGYRIMVQVLTVCITTAAAQTFTVGDGTVTLFSAPASLAVGTYGVDAGRLGIALTTATALSYTATAGVGLTISGWGYVRKD